MGLMKDSSADRQQVLKPAMAHELRGRIPRPLAEQEIDPREGSVRGRLEQAARDGVEQLERFRRRWGRHRRRCQRRSSVKNESIAAEQALGLLRCGQWPMFSMTLRVLRGMLR